MAAVLRPLGDCLTMELLLRHPAYQHRDPKRQALDLAAAEQLVEEIAQWADLAKGAIESVQAGSQQDELIAILYERAETLWYRIVPQKQGASKR